MGIKFEYKYIELTNLQTFGNEEYNFRVAGGIKAIEAAIEKLSK